MDEIMELFFNEQGRAYDVVTILDQVTDKMGAVAEQLNLPAVVLYAGGALLALVIGLFGYKLIKLLMGLGAAGVSFVAGVVLFDLITSKLKLELGDIATYVAAGVFALIMFFLSFKLFNYVMYLGMAALGYAVVGFYVGAEHMLIALAGGVVFALITMLFTRLSFVVLTSFAGGYLALAMASAIMPGVEMLQLGTGIVPIAIGAGVAFVMFVFQMITSHKAAKRAKAAAAGEKPAKLSRAEKKAQKAELKKEKLARKKEQERKLREMEALKARNYQRETMFLGFAD